MGVKVRINVELTASDFSAIEAFAIDNRITIDRAANELLKIGIGALEKKSLRR